MKALDETAARMKASDETVARMKASGGTLARICAVTRVQLYHGRMITMSRDKSRNRSSFVKLGALILPKVPMEWKKRQTYR